MQHTDRFFKYVNLCDSSILYHRYLFIYNTSSIPYNLFVGEHRVLARQSGNGCFSWWGQS